MNLNATGINEALCTWFGDAVRGIAEDSTGGKCSYGLKDLKVYLDVWTSTIDEYYE